jgi:hypothetical protein
MGEGNLQKLSQDEEMMTDEFDKELSPIPNEKYAKFFAKFAEIDTLPIEQWRTPHLLAYFCRKYKETYHVDYAWKFNNPTPSKCFECWQMNTLAAKLSANPQILKDYIDWAYQNIVPQAKRRLTSISFMTKDEVVNPYKVNVLLGGKKSPNVDRSTPLSANYQAILKVSADTSITTYGDLAFISQMEPVPSAVAAAIEKIVEMGFDMEILKRIV